MRTRLMGMATLLLLVRLNGQQQPLLGSAVADPFVLVPAFAGLEGTLVAYSSYREQWQELEGNPKSFFIGVNAPLSSLMPGTRFVGNGAGLIAFKDHTGLTERLGVRPSFNAVFNVRPLLISASIHLEGSLNRFSGDRARTPEGEYEPGTIEHKDPALAAHTSQISLLDAGASLAIHYRSGLLGLTANHLLGSASNSPTHPWKNARHGLLLANWTIKCGPWLFKPQLVFITDFRRVQSEVSAGAVYNGNIFGGLQYRGYNDRSNESLGLSFGFRLSSHWSVGYLHELRLGQSSSAPFGQSQEFTLFYRLGRAFGSGRRPPVLMSPRYLD
ncbi:MAG: PorP/SprF family type IX secretion system membrane protein [Saprospiraceae bacterium]|nr:PorP/SprF family type IX secretion system membrane protein [Saprospiraceae bacterium]